MRISFSPQRRDDALVLEKSSGDRLRINGTLFNFNGLSDGGSIPAGAIPSDFIAAMPHTGRIPDLEFGESVRRVDGEIEITLRLPVPAGCTDPWMCFPEPMTVTEDGSIDVPFASYETVTEEPVANGTKITRTRHQWRQEPVITTEVIAIEEKPANVEP